MIFLIFYDALYYYYFSSLLSRSLIPWRVKRELSVTESASVAPAPDVASDLVAETEGWQTKKRQLSTSTTVADSLFDRYSSVVNQYNTAFCSLSKSLSLLAQLKTWGGGKDRSGGSATWRKMGHCTRNSYSSRANPMSHQETLKNSHSVLGIQYKSGRYYLVSLWRVSTRWIWKMARWGCSNHPRRNRAGQQTIVVDGYCSRA